MTLVQLSATLTLNGVGIGTPADALLTHAFDVRQVATMDQGGTAGTLCDQFLDQATNTITLAAGTTTIDLQNFANSLAQTGQALARVRVLYVEHDAASAAATVTVFNAAAQSFQGPLSAGASEALAPGERLAKVSQSAAGWAVDGTHHNLAVVVAGGTATLRYFVAGSST